LKDGEEEKYLIIPELKKEVLSTGKPKPIILYV
jgi:hypothetical protein